jgi:predicted pyridoxine 5'-phosphate oxidase superfamily flavin-nucleotide-binding protein
MNRANLARLGVLAAIIALPACSGGGASAPVTSSTAFVSSVRTGEVKPASVRAEAPAIVAVPTPTSAPVVKTTQSVRLGSVLKPVSVRGDKIAPAKTATISTAASVPANIVKPSSVRADRVAPAKAIVTVTAATATAVIKTAGSVRANIAKPSSVRLNFIVPTKATVTTAGHFRSTISKPKSVRGDKNPPGASARTTQSVRAEGPHHNVTPGPYYY